MRRNRRSGRRLLFDALESRQMMAADFHFGHNFVSPEDTDGSGIVSPIDALRVINAINSGTTESTELLDVTADDALSPLDVLVVINNLNQQSGGTSSVASGVSSTARISRIAAALSLGSTSGNLTSTEANAVLETLQLGGAPELGDCTAIEDQDPATALERLATRLADLGVDSDTVDTVVSAIQERIDAGEDSYRDIVQSVLEDNGIDIKALLQQHRGEEQIAKVTARLTELGVDQSVIDSLETELTDALKAGSPYTHVQIVARLTELGIDPDTVFQRRDRGDDDSSADDALSADEVADKLEKMGVDTTIIETIVSEITAAEEAGTPWTRADLFARLKELGVTTNRGHRGRR